MINMMSRFQTAYHGRAQTALPFAMNSEFSRVLSVEMVREMEKNKKFVLKKYFQKSWESIPITISIDKCQGC